MEKVETYPLISVIIPTYNRSSLLRKAIDSVLAQTYPAIELIIADDGSTDNTRDSVSAYNDPRIHFLELSHSGHIGKVRNAGANAATGAWIAFLDSDDQWLPGKLERQMEELRITGNKWCYTGFELMNENGMHVPAKAGIYRPLSGWITKQLLSNEATVVICTLLVDRQLFEKTGGFSTDDRLEYRGDYEFALRLSLYEEALALPGVFVKVLEHNGRGTHSLQFAHERSAAPYTVFLENNNDAELRKVAEKRKAYLLAEAAVNRSAMGDRRVAMGQLARSMGKDEWRHWLSSAYRTVKASFTGPKQMPQH